MLTPYSNYSGLTPEQRDVLMSPYDMMSPRQNTYDPLRVSAYTGGSLGYMPQSQFLTPSGYGAFRTMPGANMGTMPNMQPSFWQNLLIANHGFGNIFDTYNPAVNQQVYRATAMRRAWDSGAAFGANAADFFLPGMAMSALGIGFLPGMAAGFFMPSLSQPFTDRIREARAIQQNTMSRIVSGRDVDLATGMGFSSAAAADIDRFIRRSADSDTLFKEGDYRNLMNLGIEYSMFDFSNSAEQYKEKIRQLRKIFSGAMEVIGSTDFRDILKEFKRLQDMGASSGQFNDILRLENAFARMSGMRHADMIETYGKQGSMIYAQAGLDPYQGSLQATANAAMINMAQRQGLVSESTLARMGGVSGYAQTATQHAARMDSTLSSYVAALVGNDTFTGMDKNRLLNALEKLTSGELTSRDLMSAASRVNDLGLKNAFDANKGGIFAEVQRTLDPQSFEHFRMMLARMVGREYAPGGTLQDQYISGLRAFGYDARTAQLQTRMYMDPGRQAQLDRERDLQKANEAAEIMQQNAGINDLIRIFREGLGDFADRTYGKLTRAYLNMADSSAVGTTPFLNVTRNRTFAYGRDITPNGNISISGGNETVQADSGVFNLNADSVTYADLLKHTEHVIGREAGGRTNIGDSSVVTRWWRDGHAKYGTQAWKDSDGRGFGVSYGSMQLRGDKLMDKFLERLNSDIDKASGEERETLITMRRELFGSDSVTGAEAIRMSNTNEFADRYLRLANDARYRGHMENVYAGAIWTNIDRFKSAVVDNQAIKALMGRGLSQDMILDMINHGGGNGAAGILKEFFTSEAGKGITAEQINSMNNSALLQLMLPLAEKLARKDTSLGDQAVKNLHRSLEQYIIPKHFGKGAVVSHAMTDDEYAKVAHMYKERDDALLSRYREKVRGYEDLNEGSFFSPGELKDFSKGAKLSAIFSTANSMRDPEGVIRGLLAEHRSFDANSFMRGIRELNKASDLINDKELNSLLSKAGISDWRERKAILSDKSLKRNLQAAAVRLNDTLRSNVIDMASAYSTTAMTSPRDRINKDFAEYNNFMRDAVEIITGSDNQELVNLIAQSKGFGTSANALRAVGLTTYIERYKGLAGRNLQTDKDTRILREEIKKEFPMLTDKQVDTFIGSLGKDGSSSISTLAGMVDGMGVEKYKNIEYLIGDQPIRHLYETKGLEKAFDMFEKLESKLVRTLEAQVKTVASEFGLDFSGLDITSAKDLLTMQKVLASKGGSSPFISRMASLLGSAAKQTGAAGRMQILSSAVMEKGFFEMLPKASGIRLQPTDSLDSGIVRMFNSTGGPAGGALGSPEATFSASTDKFDVSVANFGRAVTALTGVVLNKERGQGNWPGAVNPKQSAK